MAFSGHALALLRYGKRYVDVVASCIRVGANFMGFLHECFRFRVVHARNMNLHGHIDAETFLPTGTRTEINA